MKLAKYFSIIVFSSIFFYGVPGFYLLPLATYQGDLTRIGLLPESEFGWRLPQPQLENRFFRQSSFQEADVLVIGDSFSLSLVWQTILNKNNLKVHTEHWENVGGVCSNFMDWLQRQNFKGKYIIFESIERNLVSNIDKSLSCANVLYKKDARSIPEGIGSAPPVSFNTQSGDYSGRLSSGIRTQLNLIKYKVLSRSDHFQSMSLANDTTLVRMKDGCKLYSHKSCSDSLFLNEGTEDIEESTITKIQLINTRLSGITPIWAIVPNKSTAYLFPSKLFWNHLEQTIHAPNLLQMTQDAINQQVVDLYPANNTHFSTRGYLLMGDAIYKTLRDSSPK